MFNLIDFIFNSFFVPLHVWNWKLERFQQNVIRRPKNRQLFCWYQNNFCFVFFFLLLLCQIKEWKLWNIYFNIFCVNANVLWLRRTSNRHKTTKIVISKLLLTKPFNNNNNYNLKGKLKCERNVIHGTWKRISRAAAKSSRILCRPRWKYFILCKFITMNYLYCQRPIWTAPK